MNKRLKGGLWLAALVVLPALTGLAPVGPPVNIPGGGVTRATVTNIVEALISGVGGATNGIQMLNGNGTNTTLRSPNIDFDDADLTGTLPDARLSSAVAMRNASNFFSANLNLQTNVLLQWDDKPDVSWHWRRVFAKTIRGLVYGTNGSQANIIFYGDSMATLKPWMVMATITNVMPVVTMGLGALAMDGSGSQGDAGGAVTTTTNLDNWVTGSLDYLAPGTTARYSPTSSFKQGTPWLAGNRISVCVLSEVGAGTIDVYAQQYGSGAPNVKVGEIDANIGSGTNAFWTHYAVSNYSAWNIVLSNTHASASVRVIGCAIADTNAVGLALWGMQSGGQTLALTTNANLNVFSNVVSQIDGDLIFSEWKEGALAGYVTNYANALEHNYYRFTNALPKLGWLHIGTHHDNSENYTAQNLATWNHAKTHRLGYLDFNRIFKNWQAMDDAWMTEAGVHGNNLGDMYAAAIGASELGLNGLQNILNYYNLTRHVPLLGFTRLNDYGTNETFTGNTRLGTGVESTNLVQRGSNYINQFTTSDGNASTNFILNPTLFDNPTYFSGLDALPILLDASGNKFSFFVDGDSVHLNYTPIGGTQSTLVRIQRDSSDQRVYILSPTTKTAFLNSGGQIEINANGTGGNDIVWIDGEHYFFAGVLHTTSSGRRFALPNAGIIGWSATGTPSDQQHFGLGFTNGYATIFGQSAAARTNLWARDILSDGNFIGSGSGLTNIPESGVTGLTLALDFLTNSIGNGFNFSEDHDYSGSNYFGGNTTFGITPVGDGSGLTGVNGVSEAYDATNWNGDNGAATKNDVRDKIESLSLGGGSTNIVNLGDGVYVTGPSGLTNIYISETEMHLKYDTGINAIEITTGGIKLLNYGGATAFDAGSASTIIQSPDTTASMSLSNGGGISFNGTVTSSGAFTANSLAGNGAAVTNLNANTFYQPTNSWGNGVLNFALGRMVRTNLTGDFTISGITGFNPTNDNVQIVRMGVAHGTNCTVTLPGIWLVAGGGDTFVVTNGTRAELTVSAIIGDSTNAVISHFH